MFFNLPTPKRAMTFVTDEKERRDSEARTNWFTYDTTYSNVDGRKLPSHARFGRFNQAVGRAGPRSRPGW